jgi:hypothetical protein
MWSEQVGSRPARVVARSIQSWSWFSSTGLPSSVESAEDIEVARASGYAAAIVVEHFPSTRAFSLLGSTAKIVPCPAETTGKTCVECRLCMNADGLLARNLAIAFQVHGPGAKKATEALVQLRRKPRTGGAP